MKKIYNYILKGTLLLAGLASLSACKDFDDINRSPFAATNKQVQIEYFINNAIISAQMDPHIAERAFVLYHKNAAHMDGGGGINTTRVSNEWSTDYHNYLTTWLTHINTAMQLYAEKEAAGALVTGDNNMYQVARIWRVYLLSEYADNFGAMPLDGFVSEEFSFSTVEEVYNFMLTELKEATAGMNAEKVSHDKEKFDPAYGFNFAQWVKYANSLRMRLAMRLSQVAEPLARSHFEEAARGGYISTIEDNFAVQERDGWDALTGVMSRQWNHQFLSATLNNLYIGLGGITSQEQVDAYATGAIEALDNSKQKEIEALRSNTELSDDERKQQIAIKEKELIEQVNYNAPDYMGVRWASHFSTKTNDPSAGYWSDGLPHSIDPRAYKAYNIPGDINNPQFCKYPSWSTSSVTTTLRPLLRKTTNAEGKEVTDTLALVNSAFCWNAPTYGDWGDMGSLNRVYGWAGNRPRLVINFRNSSMKRVFFGAWESYFLIAEAKLRGWNVPMEAKAAYEKGIQESFAYWDKVLPTRPIQGYLTQYLASENYNRVGTSVKWDHTTEPPATLPIRYYDATDEQEKQGTYTFPTNHLYQGGTRKNDHLTKIITQKFIAQVPWLPLEAWNDHRRLGLPFFENPVIEKSIEGYSVLTDDNYMESRWEFFPQRLKYPASLQNNAPSKYAEAVSKLGGPDEVSTPLWWAGARK